MTVTVRFGCDSCFDEADGTSHLVKRPRWPVYASPQDVAPEGWIAFDPYTGCCYCPKCWAEILAPTDKAAP